MIADVYLIVAFTVVGGLFGVVRCFQAVGGGGYRATSPLIHIIRGAVIGVVLGLLAAELKDLL